jgi:hypothetical protein
MMYLLALTTTHKCWLCALVVDVCPEILDQWLRGLFSLLDGLVNFSLGILVKLLHEHHYQYGSI